MESHRRRAWRTCELVLARWRVTRTRLQVATDIGCGRRVFRRRVDSEIRHQFAVVSHAGRVSRDVVVVAAA